MDNDPQAGTIHRGDRRPDGTGMTRARLWIALFPGGSSTVGRNGPGPVPQASRSFTVVPPRTMSIGRLPGDISRFSALIPRQW